MAERQNEFESCTEENQLFLSFKEDAPEINIANVNKKKKLIK